MKTEKLFLISVNNSNVMSSFERASIEIKSPTGQSITLDKCKLIRVRQELRDIFWKFCKDPMIRFVGEMEATKREMELLKEFSDFK